MITQEYLKECLTYCEMTGTFTWNYRPENHFKDSRSHKIFNSMYANKLAAKKTKRKYQRITIDQKLYFAHRLAWLYVHGYMPKEIDHIDRNPENNKISNLRPANRVINNRNLSTRKDNKSGCKGVYFAKSINRWIARIDDMGAVYLGCFDNLLDAAAARKSAEISIGYY